MSGSVHSEVTGNVCTLIIDNPDKRNALNNTMLAGILEEVESLDGRDDIRALVITGTGEKAFSSGYDISEFSGDDAEEGGDLFDQMVDRVHDYEYPTIAMINGDVFGGAAGLIASCDLRVAVDGASFGVPPAKLGLVYGDAGIGKIMNEVGPAHAKELFFTGEPIDAERAGRIGLVNHVVERGELEDKTYEMAEQIATNAPLSLKGMKKIFQALLDKRALSDAEKQWVEEMREEAAESEDHEEGVAAFSENREPEFKGR